MKLDWRKITRKLLLTESNNKHPVTNLIDQILEQISDFKSKDQHQYMQLKDLQEQIENLKTVTDQLLTENTELQTRVAILEENKINEFLD